MAKVERCNMDGTNRTRIVDDRTEQPTALALDLVRKLVYWADVYLDYIEVVDYDGRNRHTVIQGQLVSLEGRPGSVWTLCSDVWHADIGNSC